MTHSHEALTDKEKQTLRLIVRGHDAKSTARHLGLSVHTINERLRDARRKLAVSSSREAARLLLEREGSDPDSVADKQIGEADRPDGVEQDGPGRTRLRAWIAIGAVIMSLILGIFALAALPQSGSAPASTASAAEATDAAVATSARTFLELGDQGRWNDSYAATTTSFKRLNTAEVWASVSEKVRVPLGAVRSRVLLSQESVPAPPDGIEVVKFRTSFANKPNALETVSLAHEDGAWRVVGIYIE